MTVSPVRGKNGINATAVIRDEFKIHELEKENEYLRSKVDQLHGLSYRTEKIQLEKELEELKEKARWRCCLGDPPKIEGKSIVFQTKTGWLVGFGRWAKTGYQVISSAGIRIKLHSDDFDQVSNWQWKYEADL